MALTHRVTDPTELHTITPSESDNSETINIELAIYKPLTDSSVLSVSRNPMGRKRHWRSKVQEEAENAIIDAGFGDTVNATFDEDLDLTELHLSWRKAWVEFLKSLSTVTLTVTFDPTPPRCQSEDGKAHGMWWSNEKVNDDERGFDHLRINPNDFMKFVVVLATEGRMLSQSSIDFKVNEAGLPHSARPWKMLQDRLRKLSR